jgi:serine/threonine protein kinase
MAQAGMWSARPIHLFYDLHERLRVAMLCEVTTPLAAGDTLDHYRLEAEVGRGGMSTLFRATDLRNGKQVAVKVPHAEMESDPVLIERFGAKKRSGRSWIIRAS